jgi:Asp-tRNA(Asn)/Glu-tRNA(Gln) amidotransferase A subunit family amidase
LQELLLAGEQISEARYGHALERIHSAEQELGEDVGPAHVIMGPAAPSTAPAGLSATGSPVLSRPWQALGRPVVTVPGLRAADGMPLGLQVIGRPGDETHLFHAAAWIENVVNDETAMVRRGPALLSSLTASSSEGH